MRKFKFKWLYKELLEEVLSQGQFGKSRGFAETARAATHFVWRILKCHSLVLLYAVSIAINFSSHCAI